MWRLLLGTSKTFSEEEERMMDQEDDEDMELEEGTTDDFRERAAWQSKFDAKTCFGCGQAFNPITNRHHHCRACGRVVCGACSDHKDKVRGYAKPQRTCDECHEKLQSEMDIVKAIFMLCPCLKMVRREMKRQQGGQMLSDGAIFVRKTSSLRAIGSRISGIFGGGSNEQPTMTATRVKVKLRSDGLALSITPVSGDDDDEQLYLHDVRKVEARGAKGLVLLSSSDAVLFEGDLVDAKSQSAWVTALDAAVKDAASKPPPARVERPASRVATAARRAKREIELQSKKRDAEKKKADYMKSVGGGLKYTALAMADRSSLA